MTRYSAQTLAAIGEALDDEYKARATYEAVIDRFGPQRPFINIVAAEERHAAALERLLTRAGAPIPADRWRGAVTPPATLAEAAALGAQAEIDNRDLYDRLHAMTAEPEVLRVFANLRRASQDNHLPAFRRAVDRLSGRSDRRGTGNTPAAAAETAGWRGGGNGRGWRRAATPDAPMRGAAGRGGGMSGGGTGRGHCRRGA